MIGLLDNIRERLETNAVIFSPEFLRRGRALYDNLDPANSGWRPKDEDFGVLSRCY